MLIELSIRNFRSFREKQTLKLTATASKELFENNTFEPPIKSIPRLIRSAAIYGPNAAGKSNLIMAVSFMKRFVLSSAKESQEREPIPVTPFLFDRETSKKPTEFEMIFISEGVRYQYGFAVDKKRVVEEWLLAYPGNRPQRWFERTYDSTVGEYGWYFGSKFVGTKKLWRSATRDNALFLSTAIQLNNHQLKPVFNWFNSLKVFSPKMIWSQEITIDHCLESRSKEKVLNFLKAADLSITDIELEEDEFSVDNLPKNFKLLFGEEIIKELEGEKIWKVNFFHPATDNQGSIMLPIHEESDGTQKLFAYAGPWLEMLTEGRVFFIDEIDTSLHPYIIRFLLSLVHSPRSNENNGQVIFTTHDTSLLDPGIFRRDQIWFVEKDRYNASCLYPLSDFSPRKKEALRKGYMAGRYGAIPYVRDFG